IGRLCEKMPDVHRATLSHRCENNSIIDGIKYQFAESSSVMFTNVMKNRIYELGLGDTKSETKFVPKPYLTAPVKDRIDLLRGLMDTDGSCKESPGEAYF